jgi:murein DD-endopeptidase MepM/ murein hydrolase activator NlpD
MLAARTWLVLACLAAGCAHQRSTMTFQEAGMLEPMEPEGAPPPPVAVPNPRRTPSVLPPGPPIDGSLLRFAAEAKARRQQPEAGRGFPSEAVTAWRALGSELDRYLLRSLPETPLLELMRARVTLEAELEYDRRRYGPPPPEVKESVASALQRLSARISASRALGQTLRAKLAPAVLHWPVDNAGISSTFGYRFHPLDGFRKMHYGIDLAARAGRVVTAAARGFVVQAGWSSGYGLMIEVRHAGDLTTRYSHLSRILCAPGDEVEPGQLLGLVGATGRTTGPHLHFEVWRGGRARDPLALLGARFALGSAGY